MNFKKDTDECFKGYTYIYISRKTCVLYVIKID